MFNLTNSSGSSLFGKQTLFEKQQTIQKEDTKPNEQTAMLTKGGEITQKKVSAFNQGLFSRTKDEEENKDNTYNNIKTSLFGNKQQKLLFDESKDKMNAPNLFDNSSTKTNGNSEILQKRMARYSEVINPGKKLSTSQLFGGNGQNKNKIDLSTNISNFEYPSKNDQGFSSNDNVDGQKSKNINAKNDETPSLQKNFSFNPQNFINKQKSFLSTIQQANESEDMNKTSQIDSKVEKQEEKFEIPRGDGVIRLTQNKQDSNSQNNKLNNALMTQLSNKGKDSQNQNTNFTSLFSPQTPTNTQNRPSLFPQQKKDSQQGGLRGLLTTKKQSGQHQDEKHNKFYKSAVNHPLALFNIPQAEKKNQAVIDNKDVFKEMTIGDILKIIPSLDKNVEIKFRKLGISIKQRELQLYSKESKYEQILEQLQKIKSAQKSLKSRAIMLSELIEKALLKNVKYQQKLKIMIAEEKLRDGRNDLHQSLKIDRLSYHHPMLEQKSGSKVRFLIGKAVNICKTTAIIKAKIKSLEQGGQYYCSSSSSSSSKTQSQSLISSSSSYTGTTSNSLRLLKEKKEAYSIFQKAENKIDALLKLSKQCDDDDQRIKQSQDSLSRLMTMMIQ